ncbi:glycosyltransferase family 2 protein [Tellurirhabdus rosea]|uniref:glycosyltransferase family 2 protein n=1 Tax=Tellurirhabdus rosea TaxID=2674997 RepID=UPI002256FE8C|nr:glycosyltransferase family 2 protein [Tellurirhabdus rosea]
MISIIIINYNSSAFTRQCVQSIQEKCRLPSYEIIVVDNNSEPEDAAGLEPLQRFPNLKLVASRLNLGFAGGNMLGVQHIDPRSTYYFFLNNDCVLVNDVPGLLLAYMEANPAVGACTGQMFNGEGERDSSFAYFPTLGVKLLGHGLMRTFDREAYPPLRTAYTEPVRVPVVTGAALFVRRTAFDALGGLDTTYFLYCEEEDICKRLALSGWPSVLVPAAEFIHYSGASTRRRFAIEREFYISLFYYYHKFAHPLMIPLYRLFYFFKNIRKAGRSKVYAQVAWSILKGSPRRESLRYGQKIR